MISKKGFTLLETVLFLALSGALVAALIAGTSRSISQKRYTDTVDNFVDYLQGLYSDVNYVQGNGTTGGNTGQAIYGKLIISNETNTFEEYTVVGSAKCSTAIGDNSALAVLDNCLPQARVGETPKTYKLSWGGTAENAISPNTKTAILIITHPLTGMKYTYVKTRGGSDFDTAVGTGGIFKEVTAGSGTVSRFDDTPQFEQQEIDFCLSSDDEDAAGYTSTSHKLIRIHSGANNASGVEIISDDARGGLCEG